jgi:hypothetical protein
MDPPLPATPIQQHQPLESPVQSPQHGRQYASSLSGYSAGRSNSDWDASSVLSGVEPMEPLVTTGKVKRPATVKDMTNEGQLLY